MENYNENDEKNVVENAQNENENTDKAVKNKQKKTIILLVVVLILVLVIGVGAGLAISGKGSEIVKQVVPSVEKRENEASKKIDESKDWVYDAEYDKDKSVKTVKSWDGKELSSKEDLVVPYININSDAGKNANKEIEKIYNEMYNAYGTNIDTIDIDVKKMSGLKYKYYKNNNLLSVVIEEKNYVIPGGANRCPLFVYNFNLDTLEKATNDELAKQAGYSSISEVNEIVNNWFTKVVNGESAGSIDSLVKDVYFIDGDSKLNFVYTAVAAGTYDYAMTVDEAKDGKVGDSSNNDTNKTSSYFDQNQNLNYTSNPKDSINGKVAIIKMGEKTFQKVQNNGYYTYTDDFGNTYNIKDITNITSEYKMTSNDGTTNLFKAVIEYTDNNNAKKSFDTAVIIPTDTKNAYIYGPYENYTGSTSFVKAFTDLYDDGSKGLDKISGNYERIDDTQRTTGDLTIISCSDSSLSFKINATHVNGIDIEESIAKGAVSIGEIIGAARKTADNKYEFVPQIDDPEMKDYEGNYKIEFIVKNENTIEIKETYDGIIPYAGAGVSFAGVYNK